MKRKQTLQEIRREADRKLAELDLERGPEQQASELIGEWIIRTWEALRDGIITAIRFMLRPRVFWATTTLILMVISSIYGYEYARSKYEPRVEREKALKLEYYLEAQELRDERDEALAREHEAAFAYRILEAREASERALEGNNQ